MLDPATRSAPGFERGFDTYYAGFHQRRPDEDRYQSTERRGGEVISHALQWLTEHHDGPFFVWIHLYDAHDPYDPPEPYKTRYASAPYDGEIAYDDAALGQFFKWLRLRGLFDDSLIAVMADHGEGLGDHGETTHGIFLYDETIHVPLLFKLPRGRSAGSRVEERARLFGGCVADDPWKLPASNAEQSAGGIPTHADQAGAIEDEAGFSEAKCKTRAGCAFSS